VAQGVAWAERNRSSNSILRLSEGHLLIQASVTPDPHQWTSVDDDRFPSDRHTLAALHHVALHVMVTDVGG
jgi:hypothetical protein